MAQREIKFRVYDKHWGKLAQDKDLQEYISFDDNGVVNSSSGFGSGNIVMQSTGLVDRNGKEVYECDIIDDDNYGVCQVIFNETNASFCVKLPDCRNFYFHDDIRSENFQIIGNIHTHPELLK